ncbi:Lrp/AsnC family transcriptional regulator [Candidatus Woesearchaeota archaeon]|nr:Lrp/AsnC family transcriptional regulator [Candidatus Woesearchaeota archaeon]
MKKISHQERALINGGSYRHAEILAPKHASPVRLDAKDREIISILAVNSRTPLSQIAKALQTSPEVINYRYQQLRQKRIITDTFTIIDVNLLGVYRYCAYLQFHATPHGKMESIINAFLQNKHINWVIETGGKWEIVLMFETIHLNKYEDILDSIISPIKEFLNDYMVVAVKNFTHKGPQFASGAKKNKERKSTIRFPYSKELQSRKHQQFYLTDLDGKDILLLKMIHEDSRMPLISLGEKLGLSKDAVDYRIKKLIISKIIKGFIIRLNYHLLNHQYTTTMIKFRGISAKRKAEFFRYIFEDDRFFALLEQIGTWDISLMMFFSNAKNLRDFLITIKEKFSDVIQSHESVIHFDQYYYTYLCDGVVEELMEKVKKKGDKKV